MKVGVFDQRLEKIFLVTIRTLYMGQIVYAYLDSQHLTGLPISVRSSAGHS